MENLAILVPYMLMVANVGTLVGILGYAAFCAVSKSCAMVMPANSQCSPA
jgi:hypothetical protein